MRGGCGNQHKPVSWLWSPATQPASDVFILRSASRPSLIAPHETNATYLCAYCSRCRAIYEPTEWGFAHARAVLHSRHLRACSLFGRSHPLAGCVYLVILYLIPTYCVYTIYVFKQSDCLLLWEACVSRRRRRRRQRQRRGCDVDCIIWFHYFMRSHLFGVARSRRLCSAPYLRNKIKRSMFCCMLCTFCFVKHDHVRMEIPFIGNVRAYALEHTRTHTTPRMMRDVRAGILWEQPPPPTPPARSTEIDKLSDFYCCISMHFDACGCVFAFGRSESEFVCRRTSFDFT